MTVRRVALVWSVLMLFAVSATAESREHTVCYSAKPMKKACSSAATNAGASCADDINCPGGVCESQPKFPKGIFAALNDDTGPNTVGEDKTFEVKKVKQLCVPVDKNGEGIEDPDTFWLTYGLKQAKAYCDGGINIGLSCKVDDPATCPGGTCNAQNKFDKKDAKNINVFVEDQYTQIRVNAGKVDLLMVPATVCTGDNDAACVSPANAAPSGEEHYKCYKAGATKKVCAAGNLNEFEACGGDEDCNNVAGACVSLAKFAKGQSAEAVGTIGGLNNTSRTFDIAKLTHICKAVEKTPAGGSPEGTINPNSRLLCYKSKGSKGQCTTGPTVGLACKDADDCGGGVCTEQVKFDKTDAEGQGLYVNDQFDLLDGAGPTQTGDYHRVNLAKEEMFCMPACQDPDQILSFTNDVVRAVTLEIPPTGNPGDGQDVDNNASTCQPGGCSGGIDNMLGSITGIITDLNTALQDAVTNGDINIVLELDEFANGAQTANGFIGDLDTPPGCTDINDGGQVCNYAVDASINGATCEREAPIEFDITVAGLPGSPAMITGGGIGSDLDLNLPFGSTPLALTIRNVKVGADVVHTAGTISTASGALGGAISQIELRDAINDLPEGLCGGGANDGDPCTVATQVADCDSDFCDTNYLGGFDKAFVINALEVFLVRDIDLDGIKTCQGTGVNTNNGEPCVNDVDCPEQFPTGGPACDQFDAHSIGLKFTAIDAAIGTGNLSCTKATCSLY